MKAQRIFERELNACFQTFYGYAFAMFVLLTAGIYTVLSCLKGGSADFTQVPRSMTFTFLIAIPILTMRTFAEERRQKTALLLYAHGMAAMQATGRTAFTRQQIEANMHAMHEMLLAQAK